MISIVLSLGVLVLAFGGILLFLALRGRRVDDHPLCRKCTYDLSGTATLSNVCPECGGDLQRTPKPIRIGNQRKRPTLITTGVLLLALTVGFGAIYSYNESREFDWNTIKPVWWLKRYAQAVPPEGRDARRELLRRLQNGVHSETQLIEPAELALSMQADPSIPWDSIWGDIIEHLWSNDELMPDQIEHYVERGFDVNFQVEARPRVRAGEPLPVKMGVLMQFRSPRINVDAYRLSDRRLSMRVYASSGASGPPMTLNVLLTPTQVTVDDMVVANDLPEMTYQMVQAGETRIGPIDLDLSPGVQEITFTFDLLGWEQPLGQPQSYVDGKLERPDETITQWTIERSVTVEVLPEDQSVVEMVDDPSIAQQVRDNIIQVEFIKKTIPYSPSPNWGTGGTFGGRNGMIIIESPPMDLSFEVFARAGDEEKRIGGITALKDDGLQNTQQIDVYPAMLFPDALTVDLIFRGNPKPAEETMDITRAWAGEIVIEKVPICAAQDLDEDS